MRSSKYTQKVHPGCSTCRTSSWFHYFLAAVSKIQLQGSSRMLHLLDILIALWILRSVFKIHWEQHSECYPCLAKLLCRPFRTVFKVHPGVLVRRHWWRSCAEDPGSPVGAGGRGSATGAWRILEGFWATVREAARGWVESPGRIRLSLGRTSGTHRTPHSYSGLLHHTWETQKYKKLHNCRSQE